MLHVSNRRRASAWGLHLLTACGALFALAALFTIHRGEFISAFWFMIGALAIDSFDGTLARRIGTQTAAPRLDGALLDNLVDFTTYVVVPAFFLICSDVLPASLRLPVAGVITLASLYQFSQVDAKTEDNFFKGFPSYWNILVFYLFLWQLPPLTNAIITLILAALVFVPIKYAYLSRPDHLFRQQWLKLIVLVITALWGAVTMLLLIIYPDTHPLFMGFSASYLILYMAISVYRTLFPLKLDDE